MQNTRMRGAGRSAATAWHFRRTGFRFDWPHVAVDRITRHSFDVAAASRRIQAEQHEVGKVAVLRFQFRGNRPSIMRRGRPTAARTGGVVSQPDVPTEIPACGVDEFNLKR